MSAQQDMKPPSGTGNDAQVDARRRKLIVLGASSSLLLTIASRPAWAGGNICSPSALASANMSGTHSFEGCGISAGWWGSGPGKSRWPISLGTEFHKVFDAVSVKNESEILFADLTLEDVIDIRGASSSNPANIGLHLVGAYLNALTFPPDAHPHGIGYPYTAAQVVSMYNGLVDAPIGHFQQVKNQLEDANNLYDELTEKP